MNKLNLQKNQILISLILLLIIGIANYFNYYAPPKPLEKILSFSEMSEEEQQKLINEAKHQNSSAKNKTTVNKKEPLETFSKDDDNYLNYAIDSNGSLVNWKKDRIIVYVAPSEYNYTIYQVLSYYNSTFEGYLRFFVTKKPEVADIKIEVVDSFDSNNSNEGLYMAGLTNNTMAGINKGLSSSHVQLLSTHPRTQKKLTKKDIFKVTLHEIGHAIGIIGHSPSKNDIMYATASTDRFSTRDVNTIKMMYSGDEKLVKEITKDFSATRLSEAEKYTRMSSKKAISWINLAKVYYDQGKKTEALEAYKKAIELEPTNPMVYQSMAECYYLSEKYETAIKRYQNALDYAKTQSEKVASLTMLGMCNVKLNRPSLAYNYFSQALNFDETNKSVLKNYLVICVELDKKAEALKAIDRYQKLTNIDKIEDEFINDTLKWASK